MAAVPTFVVLFPFRRKTIYRELIWIGCVIAWTIFLFRDEVAIK